MKKILSTILFLILAVVSGFGQTQYDTSPNAQTGQQVYGSYFSADLDSIALYNGNLNINIPLFSLPGRELNMSFAVSYNSQKWEQHDCEGSPCGMYTGGWKVSSPFGTGAPSYWAEPLACEIDGSWYKRQFNMNAYWIDGAGTKHRFLEKVLGTGSPYSSCSGSIASSWDDRALPSLDSDGSILYTGNSSTTPYVLYRDGLRLELPANGASQLKSINGNYLNRSTTTGLPSQDTLGRTTTYETNYDVSYNSSYFYRRYKIYDANGTLRTYQLNYGVKNVYDPWQGISSIQGNWLNSIDLPNGKSYTFEYNHPQGFLTKMILPTGAYIRYVYAASPLDLGAIHDYVKERRVSVDGTTGGEKIWLYSGIPGPTTTVVNPEGDKVVHKFNSQGQEYETLWQTSAGITLKGVTRSWSQTTVEANGQANNQKVDSATTILAGGLQAKKTVTYDANMNVTQEQQTDWGYGAPGGVILQKDITYTTVGTNYYKPASETLTAIDHSTSSFAVQGKTEFVYDEYSLTARSSVPNHTGNTSPTGRGNLTTVKRYKDASNHIDTHTKYDSVGNAVEAIDALGRSTFIDFTDNFTDSTNRYTFAYPKKVTNALSQYSTTKYDFNTGLSKEGTNLRGYATTTAYDLMNRVTSITEPNSKVTTYAYDDTNLITTKEVTVDGSGNKGRVRTYFDKLYRVTQSRTNDPEGEIAVDSLYDGNGRVKKVSNPYRVSSSPAAWTYTNYDALSRVVCASTTTLTTNPCDPGATQDAKVQYVYQNNQTTIINEAGNQRRYTYNILGKMTQVEEPSPTLETPLVTSYKYHASGTIYQTNQSGQTRTLTHDWLGRETQEVLPESGTRNYTYDAAGQILTVTDARSVVTTYSYDYLGRATQRSYSDSTPTVTFGYDASSYTGLRTSMTDALGSVSYLYDNMNRLTEERRSFDQTKSEITGTFSALYSYNVNGDLKQMTYPSGRVVNFDLAIGGGYTSSSLSSVVDATTSVTIANGMTYESSGALNARTLNPNGSVPIAETFSYNHRLQPTQARAAETSTYVMDVTYGFGTTSNVGQLLSRTDGIQPEHSTNYAYDSIYRLSQVTAADASWGIVWTFDAWSNRLTQTPQGFVQTANIVGSQALGYSNNRLTGITNLTYDSAGNLTNEGTGGHTYAFNGKNQITRLDGSSTDNYLYDGEGRRAKKKISGVSTFYFYGPGGIISEFTTTTGATSASSSDKTTYETSDRQGSAVLLIANNGLVLENNRTLPYGELWSPQVASATTRKYTTYERDSESGLDYAMNRYSAEVLGRFLSVDKGPILVHRPTTLNRYLYAGADPVNSVDPDGRETIKVECGSANPRIINCGGVSVTTTLGGGEFTAVGGMSAGAAGTGGSGGCDLIVDVNNQTVRAALDPLEGCEPPSGGGGGGETGQTPGPRPLQRLTRGRGQCPPGWTVSGEGPAYLCSPPVLRGEIVFLPATNIAQALDHVFDAEHHMGNVLSAFSGDRLRAYTHIGETVTAAVRRSQVAVQSNGVFRTIIQIGDEAITVTGRVMGEVVKISNAWKPWN